MDYNYQCPHPDYGKSADKALGAYCLLKKTCVEDCEGCKERKVEPVTLYKAMSGAMGEDNLVKLLGEVADDICEEGEEE